MTGGRSLLVTALFGFVVLVGAAVISFAIRGGFASTSAVQTPAYAPDDAVGHTVDCGTQRCLQPLMMVDVVTALQDEGFACEHQPPFGMECELKIGVTFYTARLAYADDDRDRITWIEGKVFRPAEPQAGGWPEGSPPASGTMPYFAWLGSVPFGDDRAAAAEVTTWLEQQMGTGGDANAQLGDFTYELTLSDPANVGLKVKPEEEFAS